MNRPVPPSFASQLTNPFFDRLNRPGTVWLDSSLAIHDKGHHSFLAFEPAGELICRNGQLLWKRDKKRTLFSGNCWHTFSELRTTYTGWWVGFISYEAMLPFVGIPPAALHDFLPEFHFYYYESVQEIPKETNEQKPSESQSPIAFTPAISKAEYLEKVRQIQRHIHEGDIYQANFTTRFTAKTNRDPIAVYERLRALNPAPYAAYLNFGEYQILSSSPERMLSKRGNNILTSPIKGTISRGSSPAEEERNRTQLYHSAKDRAELLMIVDLERNDLGQVAETGSVTVEPLARTETYSSLIHLVSDIRGTLRSDKTTDDLLAALLPGGSITGAPKRRAIEILSALETVPRGVYTGCIGYFHGDDAEFNIAIRTIIHKNGEYHIHAGGGIVADSNPEAEYEEMQLKARNLFRALQTEESRWE